MSLLVAATAAQTALRGVAFDSSEGVRAEVLESILSSVDEMFPVDAEILRVRGLKLTHPNREMVAVKAVPMTLGRDMEVVFPFLSASLVRFGLEEIVNAPETESKSILKRALARQVPSEMVYRPKTGPAPPFKDQLARPATIERFREQVLHPRNPLYSVIRPTVVSKMIDRAAKGIPLPHMTYTFLSTLLFTSLWIEQVREPSAAEPVSYDRRPTGSPD